MKQQQTWTAESYERNARFVSELGREVVDLLAPKPGERILDLGCGTGALMEMIAASGAEVRGFDASPDLAQAARKRGFDVDLGDAHALPYEREFDAVFSNAALHWMTRPEAVIAGVKRALKDGGRFVAEMGGHGNIAAIRAALAAVLEKRGLHLSAVRAQFFPTAGEYRRLLEAGGFEVESIEIFPRPTVLPTGIEGWLETFAKGTLAQLPESERAAAKSEVMELLRPVLCDAGGRWIADYVRLRFRARLPA